MKPIYRIGAATLLVAVLGLQGCAMGTNSNSAYSSGQAFPIQDQLGAVSEDTVALQYSLLSGLRY